LAKPAPRKPGAAEQRAAGGSASSATVDRRLFPERASGWRAPALAGPHRTAPGLRISQSTSDRQICGHLLGGEMLVPRLVASRVPDVTKLPVRPPK